MTATTRTRPKSAERTRRRVLAIFRDIANLNRSLRSFQRVSATDLNDLCESLGWSWGMKCCQDSIDSNREPIRALAFALHITEACLDGTMPITSEEATNGK